MWAWRRNSERAVAAPANVASLGLFGLIWNVGELLISALLGILCVWLGWAIGLVVLTMVLVLAAIAAIRAYGRWSRADVTAS
ncbi:MAG: hypothetical protein LV479_10000 [Methylacidiphilales bacterium]|nr:hypothetical protein [Candidatus Methylacidiphilales bacterium]